MFFLALTALLGLALSANAFAQLFPKEEAMRERFFIVNNQAYKHLPALSAVGEFWSMLGSAKEQGLSIDFYADIGASALAKAVAAYKAGLAADTPPFLFYSGYVLLHGGSRYLLPVDAKGATAAELAKSGTDLDALKKVLIGKGAPMHLFIVVGKTLDDETLKPGLKALERAAMKPFIDISMGGSSQVFAASANMVSSMMLGIGIGIPRSPADPVDAISSASAPVGAVDAVGVASTSRPAERAIGISIPSLDDLRWKAEANALRSILENMGYEVIIGEHRYDPRLEREQFEGMMKSGVSVIIAKAADDAACAILADRAASMGVRVIAYDSFIKTDSIACYLGWDWEAIGEAQARALVALKPSGRYVLLGGSPYDPAAERFRAGQMNVIGPRINAGEIEVVADQWVDHWDPANAKRLMQNIIIATGGKFDAVLASNDGTALGALEAMKAKNIRAPITGQDATAEGCNSIALGGLSATIFKDIRLLPRAAAEIADRLARGLPLEGAVTRSLAKLTGDADLLGTVPCIFLEPVIVTKENLYELVVKSGFQSWDEVYKGVRNPPPRP
jgi:D-xylose transport system substrate-binding protein